MSQLAIKTYVYTVIIIFPLLPKMIRILFFPPWILIILSPLKKEWSTKILSTQTNSKIMSRSPFHPSLKQHTADVILQELTHSVDH